MKTMVMMGVAAALVACAGADNSGDDDDGDDETIDCSLSERNGTYLLSWTELDGNCGPLPDQVVRIDPEAPLPDGCTLDAPDTVSDDQCTADRSFTCVQADGTSLSVVGTTTQETDSGSVVTGIATITGSFADGSSCVGTYRLRYERQ